MSYCNDMEFEQIPLKDWPDGLCDEAILISLTPSVIIQRCSIAFAEDFDDLDVFDAAIIRLSKGSEFALKAYRNSPSQGTEIILRKNNPGQASEIIAILGIKSNDVEWTASWYKDSMTKALTQFQDHRPDIAA